MKPNPTIHGTTYVNITSEAQEPTAEKKPTQVMSYSSSQAQLIAALRWKMEWVRVYGNGCMNIRETKDRNWHNGTFWTRLIKDRKVL